MNHELQKHQGILKGDSLRVLIPAQCSAGGSSGPSPSHLYVTSGGASSGQLSPSCNSVTSVSSFDSNSPTAHSQMNTSHYSSQSSKVANNNNEGTLLFPGSKKFYYKN